MLGVVAQLGKVETRSVVELIARKTLHGFLRIVRILLVLFHNFVFCGCKGALETPKNGHGDDDILVFVTLVRSAQFIGDGPYKVHFLRDIDGFVIPHGVDMTVMRICHNYRSISSSFSRKASGSIVIWYILISVLHLRATLIIFSLVSVSFFVLFNNICL